VIIILNLATLPDHNIFSLEGLIFRDRAMTAFSESFYIMTRGRNVNALSSLFDPLPSIRFSNFLDFAQNLLAPYNVARLGVSNG